MSQDLIKRLEAATGPDRELDAEIALALLNIKAVPDAYFYTDENNSVIFPAEIAAYTSSIDAAVALAERVLPGCDPVVRFKRKMAWIEHGNISYGATPALALCIAILKAKEAQNAQ